MSIFTTFLANVALCLLLINTANAECANACNGHGKCTAYDMCICNRNWQSNDCSERVCQFGLAHVDTAKGDLNSDGSVSLPYGSGSAVTVSSANSFVYPYGTTEKFPAMADSNGIKLTQTAHYYMECSNKGDCDRTKGECQCLDGYEGVACQRASCPGTPKCSGHGTCQSISQLASKDGNNAYDLWDKDSTMGCLCDSGYAGPDCSERQCKYGVDPLYLDDTSTVKYAEFNFATMIAIPATGVSAFTDYTKIFTNGLSDTTTGNGQWAIRFYDALGEDWLTDPLNGFATCDDILNALYALPNKVVPLNSVYCEAAAKTLTSTVSTDYIISDATGAQWLNVPGGSTINTRDGLTQIGVGSKLAFWEMGGSWSPTGTASLGQLLLQGEINAVLPDVLPDRLIQESSNATALASNAKLIGAVYNLRFLGNPGELKQPEIETYLDGKRPSLLSGVTGGKVITKVWTDGQQGENMDYFADHCDGIQVNVTQTGWVLNPVNNPSTAAGDATAKLKTCLGGSDFNTYNNVAGDVNNWDYGNRYFPHIVKLVKSPTVYTDGGYYVALYWNGAAFKLLNHFKAPGMVDATTLFDVYTTQGVLALVSETSEASFGFGSKYIYTGNPSFESGASTFSGDLSCDLYTGDTAGSGPAYNAAKVKNIFPKVNTALGTCNSETPALCSGLDAVIGFPMTKGQPVYNAETQGTLNAATARYYQGPANSYCLNRDDHFFLLNFNQTQKNPSFLNMYTVQNMKTVPSISSVSGRPSNSTRHIITADISTNWAHNFGQNLNINATDSIVDDKFLVYKFIPAQASTYNYVAECSNRGICARDTGVCQCFPGYSSDNCHTQSSLAL